MLAAVVAFQRSVVETGHRKVPLAAIPTSFRYVITMPQAWRRLVSV